MASNKRPTPLEADANGAETNLHPNSVVARFSQTLLLKPPLGHTVVLAGFLLLGFVGTGEALMRSQPIRNRLLAPSLDSPNPYFNIKMLQLEDFVAQYGSVDCIIVGTSTAAFGLDPEVLSQAFRESTGQTLHCFNLAVPLLYASVAPQLMTALVQEYQPDLVIHALDATSFYHRVDENIIAESAWLQYRLGQPNLKGLAIDQLYLFRYWLSYELMTQPDYATIAVQFRYAYRLDGFNATPAMLPNPQILFDQPPDKTTEAYWFRYFEHLSQYEIRGLEQWQPLKERGVEIVWVELPLHPTALGFIPDGGQVLPGLLEQIAGMAQIMAVPFWPTSLQPDIPSRTWLDRVHLAQPGATVASHWLGQHLANAIKTGEIQDPFQEP